VSCRFVSEPLARWTCAELRREVMAQGLVAEISGTTLWRWLGEDALRPWRHRSWIFRRDPDFAAKAGRILDLYQRRWLGMALGPRDFVLSADEKTSLAATDQRPSNLRRARICSLRCLGLYRRLGCASRQSVRPMREEERYRALRAPRRPGHASRTLSLRPPESSGSSTTALLIAANLQSTASKPNGRTSSSSIHRFTPVGLIKSKPSSNAKFSHQTTSRVLLHKGGAMRGAALRRSPPRPLR
jgi:hypothetical protein